MQTHKVLIKYKGANLVAFKDSPGWYVYHWKFLGQVGGINAHGYEIIAGPFETENQAYEYQENA